MAEVLITLTIVGVIAAITIPTLMKNMQEHAWHQQWKDDYSMLNNAFKSVVADDSSIIVSNKNSYEMTPEFINTLLSKLQVVDTCGWEGYDDNACDNNKANARIKYKWSGIQGITTRYLSLSGNSLNAYDFSNKAALLKNGASIYLGGLWSGLTIVVDVNNYTKGPNVIGKDVYALNITEIDKPDRAAWITYSKEFNAKDMMIQPYGAPNRQNIGEGNKGCAPSIGAQVHSHALSGAAGTGCSYKYLYEK